MNLGLPRREQLLRDLIQALRRSLRVQKAFDFERQQCQTPRRLSIRNAEKRRSIQSERAAGDKVATPKRNLFCSHEVSRSAEHFRRTCSCIFDGDSHRMKERPEIQVIEACEFQCEGRPGSETCSHRTVNLANEVWVTSYGNGMRLGRINEPRPTLRLQRTNETWNLSVSGANGQRLETWASTDLTNWTPIATNVVYTDQLIVTKPTSSSPRFFRATVQ
jgi:hypothetical protein